MFSRIEQLLGTEALHKLNNSKVTIFGLGGVGSYVAESLARSGIGHLVLVDADTVATSNINRQLPALHSTLGRYKTEIVQARLSDINPHCDIEIISKFYHPGDFHEFVATDTDCIVDAIDSLPSKLDLLVNAYHNNIKVFSSMGTGKKTDPTQLQLADISKTKTCPLAKKLRHQLKEQGVTKGISVVFSTEQPLEPVQPEMGSIASMLFVPASAGILLARATVMHLLNSKI